MANASADHRRTGEFLPSISPQPDPCLNIIPTEPLANKVIQLQSEGRTLFGSVATVR
jgi:hypothetical protein